MKIKALIITLLISLISNSAQAQVTPDVDFSNPKDLISVKTDPVLKDPREMISVKTDPVLSDPKGMISVKTDPVLRALQESVEGLSLNLQPVIDLISSLQKTGAKVSYRIVESNGLLLLEISVNGKPLNPFILNSAKIEFEY